MKYVFILGRALFALIFIVKPLEHFCPHMIKHADKMGVPMAGFLVPFWGLLAFIGGLSILLGYRAKIGAWLLILFLLPTTIFMHSFWNEDASFSFMMNSLCFWKNISMLGAALMITYTGSGPCSLSSVD